MEKVVYVKFYMLKTAKKLRRAGLKRIKRSAQPCGQSVIIRCSADPSEVFWIKRRSGFVAGHKNWTLRPLSLTFLVWDGWLPEG
jgi:hypothetical protein